MAGLGLDGVVLAIMIGTLAAIVYTLRIVVLMDKKLDLIMQHSGVRKK